ncbi:MAG: UDP-N-acetylglucosamine 1-carboxyvinyltransferase [Lachnospirales bacterium]
MEQFVVSGGKPLKGEVNISGAKNAAVALIPAALLANDICVIENLPNIKDIGNLINGLVDMGVDIKHTSDNTIKIDSTKLNTHIAPKTSMNKIRASYYMLGALLARVNKAEVPLPGGCNFGVRPFDQHIKGFEALGATVKVEDGFIKAYADELVGTSIYLDVVSVGATINIMIASVFAKGTTIIENAAKEPHIVDTANFLNKMGCKIKGAGTDVIRVIGISKDSIKGVDYTTIPDQIEAGTYMALAAATKGDILVKNVIPKHLESISAKLNEMGCTVEEGTDYVRVISPEVLKPTDVKTLVYPGFPTDMQPQILAVLTLADGDSLVNETVWESRFQYVEELVKMGAKVRTTGKVANITGVDSLWGAEVKAHDLRAGAAVLIAGLSHKTVGKTYIKNPKLIDRGYENIIEKLRSLGADIERVDILERD